MRTLLEDFTKKYLGTKRPELYKEAHKIKTDLEYLVSHGERTKLSSLVDYKIIPTLRCDIRDSFLEDLFSSHVSTFDKLDEYCLKIEIFEITKKLFEDRNITELLEWSKIIKFYTGLRLKDYIGSFIGCSSWCHDVEEEWTQLDKEN